MNLPADARIDALHELLGEHEREGTELRARVHDLERFRLESIETFKDLAEMLDAARGRAAAFETIIAALLKSADPGLQAKAQADLELRWRQGVGMDATDRYAPAFATAALEVCPQVALRR